MLFYRLYVKKFAIDLQKNPLIIYIEINFTCFKAKVSHTKISYDGDFYVNCRALSGPYEVFVTGRSKTEIILPGVLINKSALPLLITNGKK